MTTITGDATTSRHASRTDLDIATGIVVMVRRTTPDAAAAELMRAATDNRLSIFQLSRGLITIAGGGDLESVPASVRNVVDWHWGPFTARTGDTAVRVADPVS